MKLATFDLSKISAEETVDTAMISIWLPLSYKERFDDIQKRSHRKFGKFLKKIIIESIDNVKIEE